jgi:hypothetical protein
MTQERSRRIDALLSAVLKCEPGQCQSLLLDACKGDEELRRKVEELLSALEAVNISGHRRCRTRYVSK